MYHVNHVGIFVNGTRKETHWHVVLIEPLPLGGFNAEGLMPYTGHRYAQKATSTSKTLTEVVDFWKEALRCTT